MTAGQPVRVGVVGTGFGARVVAPVYRETPGLDVVELVTARDDAAVAALCARRDVDLISVHSPPFLHRDHVRRAVEAGHAVLCDKPFGRNLAEAQEMHDFATRTGVVNFVNFEFRQHPARRALRTLVRDGAAGRVEHVQWSVLHPWWRFDTERPYGWSFDAERGGGWIRLSGSHLIDFLRWTLGDIVDATGAVRTTITERVDPDGNVRACTAEDGYTAVLLTAAGPTVTIDGTATSSALRPNRLTVVGSDAVLELTNENPREEDARIVRYAHDDAEELFTFAQGDTYMSQMCQWAEIVRDAVRHGSADPDTPTFADGLAVAQVMDRLDRSAMRRPERSVDDGSR
jgi:predicted dehydrogenase